MLNVRETFPRKVLNFSHGWYWQQGGISRGDEKNKNTRTEPGKYPDEELDQDLNKQQQCIESEK